MATWAQKRKVTLALIAIGCFGIVGSLVAYKILYHPPTCTDGIQNGTEQGIDCGGGCVRLCVNNFSVPRVAWTRLEQVAPGLYNVAAYIANPNVSVGAKRAPYRVVLYDAQGIQITEYKGTVAIPAHRNTLAFKGSVSVSKRVPVKALFEFTQTPEWTVEKDVLSAVSISNKDFHDEGDQASLSVIVKNDNVSEIGITDVYAILYDKDGNTLGFSKTVLDRIPAYSTVVAPFTWPHGFQNKVISIEVLPVAQ